MLVHRAPAIALTAAAVLLASGCAGAAPTGADPPDRVLVLASATSAEPAPALPPAVVDLLARVATSRAAERDRTAGAVLLATADDAAPRAFALVPRRADGSVERGMQRDTLVAANVAAATAAVGRLAARSGTVDLLDAMARDTAGPGGGLLVVLSSGLSTTGGLDVRRVGWDADPAAVAAQLRARRLLPDLSRWDVLFAGLGATAGQQPPLGTDTRERLTAYWTALCVAARARSCRVEATPVATRPPVSTAPTPVVPVPGVTSVRGPSGEVATTVTDGLLGFAGDSAVVSGAGAALLADLAARIRAEGPDVDVTVRGFTADPPGATPAGMAGTARARSDAVAALLVADGLPAAAVRSLGGGPAPGETAISGGRFDEARAAPMRRVTITYGRKPS